MRVIIIALAILGTATTAAAQGTQGVQGGVQGGRGGGRAGVPLGIEPPREIGAPLVLEIGLRQYGAGGRIAGSAGNSGTSSTGKFESYVWTSSALCGMSASNNEAATVPGVGWHFTGTVLNTSSGSMSVLVEWQRLWDRGVRVQSGPAGSQTITLREGERLELDRVLPAGQSSCGAVEAKLEAAVVAMPAYRVTLNNARSLAVAGGRGGRGGGMGAGGFDPATAAMAGTMAGLRGGRPRGAVPDPQTGAASGAVAGVGRGVATGGVGRGGRGASKGVAGGIEPIGRGRGTYTMSGGRGGVAGGVTTGASGGSTYVMTGRGGVASGVGAGGRGGARGTVGDVLEANRAALASRLSSLPSVRIGARTYDAELWLVHRKPDGTETVQQQAVRFGGSVADFAFPPVQVQTSKGVITLDISGKLQTVAGTDQPGSGRMSATIRPSMTAADDSSQHIQVSIGRRARAGGPPLLDITGGSSMVIDVPAPADVLSFEFPALQKSAEDLLKGHQFSLRVRMVPILR